MARDRWPISRPRGLFPGFGGLATEMERTGISNASTGLTRGYDNSHRSTRIHHAIVPCSRSRHRLVRPLKAPQVSAKSTCTPAEIRVPCRHAARCIRREHRTGHHLQLVDQRVAFATDTLGHDANRRTSEKLELWQVHGSPSREGPSSREASSPKPKKLPKHGHFGESNPYFPRGRDFHDPIVHGSVRPRPSTTLYCALASRGGSSWSD